MHLVTHTDVMDNPRYGLHKLSLDLPFSTAIKNFAYIVSVPQLFLGMSLRTTDNEVQLATTQDLTEVSVHTYSCWFTCLVNVSLPWHYGDFY